MWLSFKAKGGALVSRRAALKSAALFLLTPKQRYNVGVHIVSILSKNEVYFASLTVEHKDTKAYTHVFMRYICLVSNNYIK